MDVPFPDVSHIFLPSRSRHCRSRSSVGSSWLKTNSLPVVRSLPNLRASRNKKATEDHSVPGRRLETKLRASACPPTLPSRSWSVRGCEVQLESQSRKGAKGGAATGKQMKVENMGMALTVCTDHQPQGDVIESCGSESPSRVPPSETGQPGFRSKTADALSPRRRVFQ